MNLINKIAFVLLISIFLTSCEKNPYDQYTASDFFSVKPNTTYEYKFTSDESKNYNIFNTYIKDDIIQQTTFTADGAIYNKLYKIEEKEIKLFYEHGSSYLLDDITATEQTDITKIIQMPFKLNKKWSAKKNTTYEVTGLEVDITVPYGTFKAIELKAVTVIKNKNNETAHVVSEFYAKDIGLIKREETLEDGTILLSELANIKENSPYEMNIDIFYPKDNSDELQAFPKKIVFNTNDNIPDIIKKSLTEKIDNTDKTLFGDITKINKLNIVNNFDSNGGILDNYIDIDLSKDYIDFINKNPDKEISLLKALANSLCSNRNVNRVKLTIDGNLYKSNTRELIEDEFLSSVK